jgi:hypothetical protein
MNKTREESPVSAATAAQIMAEIERHSVMDKIEEELNKKIEKKETERDLRLN